MSYAVARPPGKPPASLQNDAPQGTRHESLSFALSFSEDSASIVTPVSVRAGSATDSAAD